MQCSIQQASCSATICETPSVTKNFVKTQWRSYTCSAIFLPASVKIIWRFSYITNPFSDNLLTALHTDTLERFIAAASLTSRIVLQCSLKRKIVSKYISIDSFFSIFLPLYGYYYFSPLTFFLRTSMTVTITAAATTSTHATRITAYPHIGMTNATPGIQTINVPVLSVSNRTYRP